MRRETQAKCEKGFELGSESGGEGKRWVSRQGNYVRGRGDRAQNELGHVEL